MIQSENLKIVLVCPQRKAIEQNNDQIYSDVSLTAKGFFEKNGFVVESQQLKKSKQKELINFRMVKNNKCQQHYTISRQVQNRTLKKNKS